MNWWDFTFDNTSDYCVIPVLVLWIFVDDADWLQAIIPQILTAGWTVLCCHQNIALLSAVKFLNFNQTYTPMCASFTEYVTPFDDLLYCVCDC